MILLRPERRRIIGGSPADLDALVAREIQQFKTVVREQGLKPE